MTHLDYSVLAEQESSNCARYYIKMLLKSFFGALAVAPLTSGLSLGLDETSSDSLIADLDTLLSSDSGSV